MTLYDKMMDDHGDGDRQRRMTGRTKQTPVDDPAGADPWRYARGRDFYDELLEAGGDYRPHWQPLIESLDTTGPEGLAQRWQEGRRIIRDHGVTYNVYGDPQKKDRPWPLDPVPFLIDRPEWAAIEAAVIQRATLLNQMLADLYGPQKLLRDSQVPAELIFRHPGFLRPCHGIAPPGGVWLHIYAADIARSPDGRWWVLADRTQAPSGSGYALENRIVTSRVLPEIFRASRVERLATFFQTIRATLRQLAPSRAENPRIVLLTPGPYNETYFEHAFLARYLGYTLVEGGDLTVRNNHVFLKTLGGLLPVDGILRRQDDSYCDPLELRGDSMLGVPGLMQAVRSGNVTMANALGTGLIESAAYSAFLPGLCRHLLGEELKMPSVATWWCGQEDPFSYVAENLNRLVIKPAFAGTRQEPVFAARLSEKERAELLEKMRAQPGSFVAQEQVALSTVPVWEQGGLHPRHMVLRVYAAATDGSYAVMPGGLTRVTSSLDSLVVSMQGGGGSKDTWVMAEGPTSQFSLLRPSGGGIEISRATFDLPSRVADNLYWLGRYTERAELGVRLARMILPRLVQESDPSNIAGVKFGLQVLAALGFTRTEPELPGKPSVLQSAEKEVLALIYDSEARGSLTWNIHQVRRVGWLLRDRISADAWRVINQLDQQFSSPPPPDGLQVIVAQDLLDRTIITLSAFSGLAMESMTRGDGWRFLDIGRRLERAAQMVDMLKHGVGPELVTETGQLEALLEVADSIMTYRSRYLTSMQEDLVLDLLLLDEVNPRSVAFQLLRLHEHIVELPESRLQTRRPWEARLALSALNSVQMTEASDLIQADGDGHLTQFEILLSRLTGDLRQLSETLTRSYFNHAIPSRQISAP